MDIDIGLYKTVEGYKVNVFAKIPDSANYIAAMSIPSFNIPYIVEYYPSGIQTNTMSNMIVGKWVEPLKLNNILIKIYKSSYGEVYPSLNSNLNEPVRENELARCVVKWEEGRGFYI